MNRSFKKYEITHGMVNITVYDILKLIDCSLDIKMCKYIVDKYKAEKADIVYYNAWKKNIDYDLDESNKSLEKAKNKFNKLLTKYPIPRELIAYDLDEAIKHLITISNDLKFAFEECTQ